MINIKIKTPEQIEKITQACVLTSQTMGQIARAIHPGATTQQLNRIAIDYITGHGGIPACLGYGGFPGAICAEPNEIIVHGFPNNNPLKEGDIIGIDLVVELNGYMGDMCFTFPVGQIDPAKHRLCAVTKHSLQLGIQAARAGQRIGDISAAVQRYCEKAGYTIVREMCGHGIGRQMHEDPEIPNYGRPGTGPVIHNGMTLCIEPMVNMGSRNIIIEADGWTCRTRDRRPSAHFEHTIAIQDGQTHTLTSFLPIYEALGHDPFPAPETQP